MPSGTSTLPGRAAGSGARTTFGRIFRKLYALYLRSLPVWCHHWHQLLDAQYALEVPPDGVDRSKDLAASPAPPIDPPDSGRSGKIVRNPWLDSRIQRIRHRGAPPPPDGASRGWAPCSDCTRRYYGARRTLCSPREM
eukprot:SAG31_NODE_3745_length_3929_cov_2.044125_6_plen_138_part_00